MTYKMKKNYPDMRILDETDKYFIGHIFEDAYLIEKRNGEEIVHDDFYGDPSCGLIGENNDWAIIAGEHLTIWKSGTKPKMDNAWLKWLHAIWAIIWGERQSKWQKGKITKIEHEDLKWIHALRTKDDKVVEILIDPWSDKSAIWSLDISTLDFKKIKNFKDYKEKEQVDDVIW